MRSVFAELQLLQGPGAVCQDGWIVRVTSGVVRLQSATETLEGSLASSPFLFSPTEIRQ